jgi:Na+/pantothenate symporter
MSEEDTMGRTYFSRFLRGIMKLLMAGFIVGAVSAITIPDLQVGDSVVSGALIKAILQFVIPVYIIISALDDFGVKL